MKKRAWVLIGIAGLLLVSLPQSAKGDNRRALAEELMNVRHIQETMKETVTVVKQMMKQMMASQMKNAGVNVPAASAAAQEKLMNTLMDLVTNEMGWDKIKDDYISMYADTYTEEELKGQIAFYKSPVGQATVSKEPELVRKAMEIQQKRMLQLMPKIQAMVKESMPKAQPAGPEKTGN